nr:hypothetical protein [Tanacetum cinerariifolium]
MVTKLRNEITNFRQCPDDSLFKAWERYKLSIDRCPNHNMLRVSQIDTFYNGLTLRHRDTINAAAGGTFMKRRSEECYDLIENITAHHNDWDTSAQQTTVGNTQNVYATGAYQGEQPRRNQFFQGASHGQNPPPAYQALAYQASGYQAPVHQPQIPQPQVVTTNEFTNFMKANDAILKNMQTNMTSLTKSNLELKNMFGQFIKMNTASSSGSGTLPSNTITNPKEDLKGITTRSGTVYQGPTIPTSSSYFPPVVELSAPKPNQRPSIPYLSILYDQKLQDKANDQRDKFFQIFKDLNFNISFVDALILMPKFGPSIKSLLTNKDKLFDLSKTSLNEHYSAVLKSCQKTRGPRQNELSLQELTLTLMTLELADRSISRPIGVTEDVYVAVGKFHFPANFIVVDFDVDPQVPLILERSFLKTGRTLIDVFEVELTLRVSKEAITFNLDQTSRYSANYNDMMANRIDVIDMACDEYSQEVLGFYDVIASGNPTPYYDPIVSTTSPTLTLFGNNDFLLEEVDAFLALKVDPTSPNVDQSYVDTEGDILLLKAFFNDDPSLPSKSRKLYTSNFKPVVQHQRRVNPKFHDVIKNEVLKFLDAGLIYPISASPWETSTTVFSTISLVISKFPLIRKIKKKPHSLVHTEHLLTTIFLLGYAMHRARFRESLYGQRGYSPRPLKRIEVDKAKVDVIAKLPHPTTVKGIRSFLGHASLYRWFIQNFSKIARLMTRLLEKDTPFLFSKECVEAFQTLKRKLTEAPILIAPDWDLPFDLMCDASDFAIGAVLG